MLKFYSVEYKTYNNGTLIGTRHGKTLIDEKEMEERIFSVKWDNLEEVYQKYSLMLPFNIWHFKKGRVVSFFEGLPFKKDFQDIKEWKRELNIVIQITYLDISASMSIDEILKWHNAEKAIQYLNERGLKLK